MNRFSLFAIASTITAFLGSVMFNDSSAATRILVGAILGIGFGIAATLAFGRCGARRVSQGSSN